MNLCKTSVFIFLLGFFLKSFAFSAYSTRELEELEKEFIQLINQSENIERHPLATQYINQLGKKLAQHVPLPFLHFFIVKSEEINAFAGPGGHIGINTQLILSTSNESELAAVMAHEIAHVHLHHLYSVIQHEKQMRIPLLASVLASAALGIVNPTLGGSALLASISGLAQDNINFTRANEKEADRIGMNMLIKAGFDARSMATFFKKMQENSRYYYTATIPAILRTHPLDEERIAEAENRSQNVAIPPITHHLDYPLFKELLRVSVTNSSKQLLDYYRACSEKNTSVCHYGYALTLLRINKYSYAINQLTPLINENPENFFYQTAMAEAELGAKKINQALGRLERLYENYPENYAIIMAYSQGLILAGKAEKATQLLIKGFRLFKKDLALCEMLARSQASSHHKDFAYFTKAQCHLLQGRQREALRQLKQAKLLAKQNSYLNARIDALGEDIPK